MRLAPATFPWLLRHELRITFRTAKRGEWSVAIGIVLYLIFSGIGAISAMGFAKMRVPEPALHLILGGVGLFMLFIGFAVAVPLLINAFYTRADFDLLLSSPLSPRVLLPVRLSAVLIAAGAGTLLFTSPFINGGAALVSARWLLGYLTLPALTLIAITTAFLLLVLAVRLLGARRARTALQVFAGILGIGGALSGQIPNMMMNRHDGGGRGSLGWADSVAEMPIADVLRGLGAAMAGETAPLLILLLIGWGGFILTVTLGGGAFQRLVAAIMAMDASAKKKRRASGGRPLRFSGSGPVLTLMRREWRLLARDPNLLTQVVSIMVIALPIAIPTLHKTIKSGDGLPFPMAWLGVLPAVGLLAGALAWLAVAAEDAPDLLGTAPIARRNIVLGQAAAAGGPPMLILTLCSLYLLPTHPLQAPIYWLVGLTAILIFILFDREQAPTTVGRRGFQKRYQGHYLVLMGEMLLAVLVYGIAVLALWLSPLWVLPVLLVLIAALMAGIMRPAARSEATS